jgi:ABC-type bacteriocin/lantibiotic exporter with double-glycine peptidase domain
MNLLDLPPFQETLNQSMCGPATLKMLLMFYNLPGGELADVELAKRCGTDPKLGTSNEQFLSTAEQFGLSAHVKTLAELNDIKAWIEKGVPVIVDWFSPGRKDAADGDMPDGHYSIVVGLDDKNIYLQDPELGALRTIPHEQFYRVWFDFKQDTITDWDTMVIRWMAAVYPTKMS